MHDGIEWIRRSLSSATAASGRATMDAMLFWLPEYDRAAKHCFFGAVDALTVLIEPALAVFPREPVQVVRPSRITVSQDRSLVVAPEHHQSAGTFDIRQIVAGDLTGVLQDIHRTATEVAAARLAYMTQTLHDVTAATGQVAEVGGVSWEGVMEAIEQVGTGFDEHDQPTFMIWPPEAAAAFAALPPRTPEQETAWQELMARKLTEFRAKRSRRDLA